MKRYCQQHIINDLEKKMVFIGGPRQVGKTSLIKAIGQQAYQHTDYFNWDVDEDRRWQQSSPLVIFDELHKYPHWKNWIKGIYDTIKTLTFH